MPEATLPAATPLPEAPLPEVLLPEPRRLRISAGPRPFSACSRALCHSFIVIGRRPGGGGCAPCPGMPTAPVRPGVCLPGVHPVRVPLEEPDARRVLRLLSPPVPLALAAVPPRQFCVTEENVGVRAPVSGICDAPDVAKSRSSCDAPNPSCATRVAPMQPPKPPPTPGVERPTARPAPEPSAAAVARPSATRR